MVKADRGWYKRYARLQAEKKRDQERLDAISKQSKQESEAKSRQS